MYASAEVVECFDAKGEDVCVARFSDGAVCEAVLAEAIPESEAKLCDAVPVAEIFGATMILLANIIPAVPVSKTGKVKDKDLEWGPSKKILLGDIPKVSLHLLMF